MSQQTLDMNFSGQMRKATGEVRMQSVGNALMKGMLACLFMWLLAVISILAPFAQWTLPFIFLAAGPIVGIVAYVMDRRAVGNVDGHTSCPRCGSEFDFHESNFKHHFYGSCPSCHTSFEAKIPALARVRAR